VADAGPDQGHLFRTVNISWNGRSGLCITSYFVRLEFIRARISLLWEMMLWVITSLSMVFCEIFVHAFVAELYDGESI